MGMKYKIEFQYKGEGNARPFDEVQPEDISSETGEYAPTPAVGDIVACKLRGRMESSKVLTRHFAYLQDQEDRHRSWCCVNLVATDVKAEEMASRLKE